jgi:hypothetical protein
MNPMERALARADKTVAAQNAMEGMSRSPASHIHGLQHGGKIELSAGEHAVTVSYHRRQSYGDMGQRVSGAYTGEFTVDYGNGRTQDFPHGPHATTPLAGKRGANPSAKAYAADQAHQAVVRHLQSASLFSDRR